MKVTLVVFVAVLGVALAEPPVPSSQYLPSNQYGPPSRQYGAPAQTTAILRPNTQYGAPSEQYGAPRPGGNYLPPSNGNNGNNGYASNGGYADNEPTEPANYQFEYHVEDAASGNDFGHEEQRQGDVAQGKYFVLLPDGRRQVVEYTADSEGYKPKISYEQVNNGGYQNGGYPRGGGGGNNNNNNNNNGGYQY